MSAYSNLPPIKPPRSMAWYSDIASEKDDALDEGLRLLESLRGVLPAHKSCAIDRAKELLISAAALYNEARRAKDRLSGDPSALSHLLSPDKAKLLQQLYDTISQN